MLNVSRQFYISHRKSYQLTFQITVSVSLRYYQPKNYWKITPFIHNFLLPCYFGSIKFTWSIYSSTNWSLIGKLINLMILIWNFTCREITIQRTKNYIIKNKSISAILIKHFYHQVMNKSWEDAFVLVFLVKIIIRSILKK